MAVTSKALIEAKQLENTQTTQYTATGLEAAIITKFTVTNASGADVTFSCNLVAASGTPGNANLIVKDRVISPNESYECPQLVGQVISENGFISTIASAASSLTARASGIEIS